MPWFDMVEGSSSLREVLRNVAKERVPRGSDTGRESWRERELVACEEARSRRRGQHQRGHAREAWADRREMGRDLQHVLCFLAQRIAQRVGVAVPERVAPFRAGVELQDSLTVSAADSRRRARNNRGRSTAG